MLRKKTVIKTVKDYLKKLPIKVEEAIIFGSTARGERLWDSDIDLIVISPDFESMDFHKRCVLLFKHWKHERVPLEAFGYTMKEYRDRVGKSLWFKEINEYGIRLSRVGGNREDKN